MSKLIYLQIVIHLLATTIAPYDTAYYPCHIQSLIHRAGTVIPISLAKGLELSVSQGIPPVRTRQFNMNSFIFSAYIA